jgi:propionyl-CoA carboxylase beta chain
MIRQGPREWIAQLVDDADPSAALEAEDGIVSGIAKVNGQTIAFYAQEPSVRQGFVSSKGAARILAVMNRAQELSVPIVAFMCSPGVDVQEGLKSGEAYTKVIAKTIALAGVIPQIAVVMGVTMGAPAYSCALMDLVLFNKSRSHLVVTGPTVVEKMLGQKTTLGELGGSDTHSRMTGLAHFVDANPSAQIDRLKSILSFLTIQTRVAEPPILPLPSIPDRPSGPFDMRAFVSALVDRSEHIEMSPPFGRAMITSFAYLEGLRVGVVANQSKDTTGAIDVDAARKATRFLHLCDAFGIPIVTLIDVPGFMPGVREEQRGLLIHGANLCAAMQTRVPRVSVVVRRCYGAAAFLLLQSRAQGGELVLALEGARIATMGFEAAKHMVYGDDLSALPEKQDELRAAYFRDYESPLIARANNLVDEIVSSTEVRSRLAKHLRDRTSPLS